MISVTNVKRLWLVRHKVDFRKQEKSLLAEAVAMGLDPHEGDLLLFIGGTKRKIKLLYADSTGMWLSKKCFTVEAMKTHFRFLENMEVSKISSAELAMFVEGTAFTVGKRVKPWPKLT